MKYSDAPTATSSLNYVTVPSSPTDIVVPNDRFQQVLVRFTAESRCSGGPANSYCTARIRARNLLTNAVVDFNPQPSKDFAFDSASDDIYESNSMARVNHLGEGTWRVEAQYAVTNTANSFRVDDWTLEIDQLNETPVT